MTDDDLEALSRLLDDDLPPGRADALRERIAREPALAARWRAMQGLPSRLAATAAPTHLHEAILGPARPPARWLAAWPSLLAAAAVGMVVGRMVTPATTVTQVTTGRAEVAIGGALVQIDGQAELRVEPPGRLGREDPPDDSGDPMRAQTLLAGAAAGALLTVTVQQGLARLTPPEGADAERKAPVTLGEAPRRVAPGAAPSVLAPPEADAGADALELLQFENALLRGQLVAAEGTFEDWPIDVEARFLPEALRVGIEDHLDGRGTIVGSDCDEYPCLHFVEYDADQLPETPTDLLEELMATMTSGRWEGAQVPNVFVANLEDDEGQRRLVGGIAVQTPDDLGNENLQQRLDQRGRRLLEDVLSSRD